MRVENEGEPSESPCQAPQSCAAASSSVSESVNRIVSRYWVVGGDGEGWYSGVAEWHWLRRESKKLFAEVSVWVASRGSLQCLP